MLMNDRRERREMRRIKLPSPLPNTKHFLFIARMLDEEDMLLPYTLD